MSDVQSTPRETPEPPENGPVPVTAERATPPATEAQLAVARAAGRLPAADRRALAEWLDALLAVRRREGSALRKALEALRVEDAARSLAPLAGATGRMVYDLAWRDRTWTERLGVGAAALLAAAAPAAGAAAVGGAIGVPLWVVRGSGDAFAVALRDELRRSLEPEGGARPADGLVVDADYQIVPAGDDMPEFEMVPVDGEREPLFRVFRRAYRQARARQQSGGAG